MKNGAIKILIIFAAAVLLTGPIVFLFYQKEKSQRDVARKSPLTQEFDMELTSSAFLNNNRIPQKYTCDGENINPPLTIKNVPDGANSLALIVEDPDAPRGVFVHWTVWNINPATEVIKENSVPEGAIEGMTDFGRKGYGGPCPPSGTHRYFFKLYALDTLLTLDSSATPTNLERTIEGHIIEKTELVGFYSRE